MVVDLRGSGLQHGWLVAVEDLMDALGVGAEHGHELGSGHGLPLPGEEGPEPQQVNRAS